jgi:hypothetical protein
MTDLFDDTDETPVIDPNKDYLSELVGEGKKYKDPAALARAVMEKESFIEKLKGETSGLRQELNTRLKLEEVVDRISKPQSPSSEAIQQATEQDGQPAINPEDIVQKVRDSLTADQKKAQRAKNLEYVESKLQEAFGPGFKRTMKQQAQKLGLGQDFSQNLAAEQPEAFLKLFDVKPQPEVNSTAQDIPQSSFNSESLGFRPDTGVRRKSYYDNLKKADAKAYWSVSVQNQMHKDAQKQGEAFFDRT